MDRRQAATVGGRVRQPLVGRGPERLCPAAQGRRRGVRLDCRTVGQRAGDRVRSVRRPPGGRRGGERGGQQRGPRLDGQESGVRGAQSQAERERGPPAAVHGRDERSGGTADHGH